MLPIETILKQGESETLEFKPSFNRDVIETAAAFANTRGGRVVVGVSNAAVPLGVSFSQEALRDAVNRISNATEPSVIPDAEKVSLPGGEVMVLTVPEYPLKPIAVRGRCFKRSGSTTRQMTPAEIAEVHLQCTGQSADALLIEGKTIEDLNMDQVRLYMTRASNSGRRSFSGNDDPVAILQKLELIRGEHGITRAAILLFGKNPQSPFSQSVVHAGKIREAVDIMDDRFIRGSIIDQVEESLDFIKKHINVQSIITGKSRRDDVWDYPLDALREALTNAVCHRDYGDLGDIQIKIYDRSLQIWSPGFLPFGMTVEELLQPNHSSKPRNRLIAQAFYDMGMIEQYGSGIKRVVDACLDAGLPEPEFENFSGGFQIVFKPPSQVTPREGAKLHPKKVPAEAPVSEQVTSHDKAHDEAYDEAHDEAHDVLNNTEILILQECSKQPMSTQQLLELLGYRTRTGNFKKAISRLTNDLCLLDPTLPDKPRSKNQKYRLTEKGKQFLKGIES